MCDHTIDDLEKDEDFTKLSALIDDPKAIDEGYHSKNKKSLSEYFQALLKRFGMHENETNYQS